MLVKTIMDEDFVNYKKPAMFIGMPTCSGKCCLEQGLPPTICHNHDWGASPSVNVSAENICRRYLSNPLTQAVVLGGLEPFDSFPEVYAFITTLRSLSSCDDDVVIYTGYVPNEVSEELRMLRKHPNIIIKFGRYFPNQKPHYDETLGVNLASDNQYAVRLDEMNL